jgi:chorismate mutase/prephenate dehydratase
VLRDAAEAVRQGTADVALLPIENSTAGSINETYDALAAGGLTIIAEVVSQVSHCLLALSGSSLKDLRTVISHPQALLQCEVFLRSVPWIQARVEFDTAGAARKVKESNDPTLAAIASESAARVFGLHVLKRDIQSQRANYTRFVELAREPATCPADAACKTSLLLVTAHTPGALGEVLLQFSRRGVNLCKLESRPIPERPWQYRFYLDVEGHAASRALTEALDAAAPFAEELRLLGTYPRAAAAIGGARRRERGRRKAAS